MTTNKKDVVDVVSKFLVDGNSLSFRSSQIVVAEGAGLHEYREIMKSCVFAKAARKDVIAENVAETKIPTKESKSLANVFSEELESLHQDPTFVGSDLQLESQEFTQ